jgi:beta-glucanase (GH16 family)
MMNKLLLLFCLSTMTVLGYSQERELIWADEFDGKELVDESIWTNEVGLLRNKEAQYYTNNRSKNARVENGMLIIEAHKEKYKGAKYTSASIHTNGKKEILYGKIEVRAKLPEGRGTWPAIWTLGTNKKQTRWPNCGEIDIMEHVGYNPNVVQVTTHTDKYNHSENTAKPSGRKNIPTASSEFHTYAIDWTKEKIDFLIDDEVIHSYKNEHTGVDSWPFDSPQYLIINLAIGGGWGGKEGIDDSIFPVKYYIDYVRIYR